MQDIEAAIAVGEMFICSNIGANLSEMEVRAFVRK